MFRKSVKFLVNILNPPVRIFVSYVTNKNLCFYEA